MVCVTVRAALLGVWLITSACYAYRPVALAPTAGSRVRIVFTTASVVTTLQPGPDSTRRTYAGVLEASGTIQAAASDTIALRLDELRTATGAVSNVSDQVALVPTAQIGRIEERRFQAGTTALTAVGVSALALATLLVLIIASITRAF